MPEPAFPPVPRIWWRASLVGGALALALFAWVLAIGRTELTAAPTGDFYDLQARAWFDGRWDIADRIDPTTGDPYSPLSIEAIVVDGRDYLYYGPVPSLLRVPVLAVTDDLDGELTQPSMLLAFATALAASTILHWRIRCLVRGRDRPLTGAEPWLVGLVVATIGAGTVLLYLGSQPTVYHEAELWGAALALAAFVPVLAVAVRPRPATIALAGVLATSALLTRASVGAGPVAALGLLLLRQLWWTWRSRSDAGSAGTRWRPVAALALACLVPVAVYALVNHARFGAWFRLPLEQQVFSSVDPGRIAALEDNDGSLFGLQFVPSTLWQYARPDALELDRLAPWVTFPREPATVIGDATFDTRDEASSVPATMPALTALAVVGAVALARRRALRPLAYPVAGALVGVLPVLTIAFIAHRYLADLVVPLLVLALAGWQVTLAWWPATSVGRRRAAGAALGVAALWGVVANLALAVEYQRLIAPVDLGTRSAFVAWQYTLPTFGAEAPVGAEPAPDDPGQRGDIRRVRTDGGCVVWWTDGFTWRVLDGVSCATVADGSG